MKIESNINYLEFLNKDQMARAKELLESLMDEVFIKKL